MIEISKDTIEFLAKDRRKKKSDKSRDLLSAVSCPQCNNIIYATFLTDKPIDLWEYEQSSILKLRGTYDIGSFSHYFPTVESEKGESCYESTTTKIEGQVIQTLRMKNHVLSPDRIGKSALDKYEVGERPCTNTGTVSLRKDMALKTALALVGITVPDLEKWNWAEKSDATLDDCKSSGQGFQLAETKGPIPIYGVLIPKDKITYGIWMANKSKYYA